MKYIKTFEFFSDRSVPHVLRDDSVLCYYKTSDLEIGREYYLKSLTSGVEPFKVRVEKILDRYYFEGTVTETSEKFKKMMLYRFDNDIIEDETTGTGVSPRKNYIKEGETYRFCIRLVIANPDDTVTIGDQILYEPCSKRKLILPKEKPLPKEMPKTGEYVGEKFSNKNAIEEILKDKSVLDIVKLHEPYDYEKFAEYLKDVNWNEKDRENMSDNEIANEFSEWLEDPKKVRDSRK